jgi:hypothetical protein
MRPVAVRWASRLVVATLMFLTWWWVILSAAAPRTSDNGVFLSVASAIADGVPLYEGVVDNKDPLFFYSLAAALRIGPAAAQLLDVLWFVCLAAGAWLLARSTMRATVAVVAGFVAAPIAVLGIAYQPGLTNLPGTALVFAGNGFAGQSCVVGKRIRFCLGRCRQDHDCSSRGHDPRGGHCAATYAQAWFPSGGRLRRFSVWLGASAVDSWISGRLPKGARAQFALFRGRDGLFRPNSRCLGSPGAMGC